MSLGSVINFKQLLDAHDHIQIPMIQRDYAQGRPEVEQIREEFLKILKEALDKPADDASLPLNLDFIYGSVERKDEKIRFQPLDGQQRLTTLFLLHWYLAWRDNQWDVFDQLFLADGLSRFTYSVRPSSNDFFNQLVNYHPDASPEDVPSLADMISDQHWYFRNWRLDPTIQAVLHMLDAIHTRFRVSSGLFARLIHEKCPAITFHLLDLDNFGLSDDLYIKMNARGKPLTSFETFKARYEQELKNQFSGKTFLIGEQHFSVADYVAIRMDTSWADLFWKLRNPGSSHFDNAFMNVFRTVALISRNPESPEYLDDINRLRNEGNPPSYTDFHSKKWLDENFTNTLMTLLDRWSSNNNEIPQLLPYGWYRDEKALFVAIATKGANLSYTDLVLLTGYTYFILKYEAGIDLLIFKEWMRIIRNLAVNSVYNSPDDFRRSVRGLMDLLEHSSNPLVHFSSALKAATGFIELQVAEEQTKAKLLLSHNGWRSLVDRAEQHGYFCGQIGFLLDFAGIETKSSETPPKNWDASDHVSMQDNFLHYLEIAESMFTEEGLVDSGEHLWQRAMLCFGDYLLPVGRFRSFLVNSKTDDGSWKRLLSGSTLRSIDSRNYLKKLMEKLSPEKDISKQLNNIINSSVVIDYWRKIIVRSSAVLNYCKRGLIRDERDTIYLLPRSQMRGYHVELFTFCLYQQLVLEPLKSKLAPLRMQEYYFSQTLAINPGIRFLWNDANCHIFDLDGNRDGFVLYHSLNSDDQELPPVVKFLIGTAGYTQTIGRVEKKCTHSDIFNVIGDLRKHLIEFAERRGCNA